MLFSRHQVAFHLKKKQKTGGIKEGREGWRRSRCGALISSLMDFVSGVSVRNHAFIMGREGEGVTYWRRYWQHNTSNVSSEIAFRFTADVTGKHLHWGGRSVARERARTPSQTPVRRTYLLKRLHSVNRELKLPAVLIYADYNLS